MNASLYSQTKNFKGDDVASQTEQVGVFLPVPSCFQFLGLLSPPYRRVSLENAMVQWVEAGAAEAVLSVKTPLAGDE
jgi:hypothetical protein